MIKIIFVTLIAFCSTKIKETSYENLEVSKTLVKIRSLPGVPGHPS